MLKSLLQSPEILQRLTPKTHATQVWEFVNGQLSSDLLPNSKPLHPDLHLCCASYSVKLRSLVNSSSNSWRSASEILFWRLGISDLASSALSQHKLPNEAITV